MQSQLAKEDSVDAEALAAVEEWRQKFEFWEPVRRVVPSGRPAARDLLKRVRGWLHDTFNSATLMRLNFELLVAVGDSTEAHAAFSTYAGLSQLQELKLRSGARASPDSEIGRVSAFEQELEQLLRVDHDVDAVVELGRNLERVMPTANHSAVRRAHGILARVAVADADASPDPEVYTRLVEKASAHFAELSHPGDAAQPLTDLGPETCRTHVAFVARTRGPRRAFPLAHRAVMAFPWHAGLVNLLALLLSAENQLVAAVALVERFLADVIPENSVQTLGPWVCRDIVELKKTHVALIDAQHGVGSALELLPSLTDLIGSLWGFQPPSDGEKPLSQNGSHHKHLISRRSFLGLRRKYVIVEDKNDGRDSNQKASDNLTGYPRSEEAQLWLWIAQLYLRAGLATDARRAIEEARPAAPYAEIHALVGSLDLTQGHLRKAWKHFSIALNSDVSNLRAAIGSAQILALNDTISKPDSGEQDSSASIPTATTSPGSNPEEVVFDSQQQALESKRLILGLLESLTTRNSGRHVAEAWYALGTLYESLGDTTAARTALWRSVELSEARGARLVSYI